ncbi:MAG: MerR family transcriptional regulator [Ferruginibacter sp.]
MAGLKQIAFDFEATAAPVAEPVVETQVTVPVAATVLPVVEEAEEPAIDFSEPVNTAVTAPAAKRKKLHNKKSTRGRMSLKEADTGADLIEIPEDEVLFQKLYYPIGTVAEMFKVNQSLIRFWENEFDILKPRKNGKGDRLFRPEDVKNLKLIYHLLRERKYTIEGAKEFLKNSKKADEKFALIESLKKIKSFLLELKASL